MIDLSKITKELSDATGVSEQDTQKVLNALGLSSKLLEEKVLSDTQLNLSDIRLSTRIAGLVVAL